MTTPLVTYPGIDQIKSAYYTKTLGPFPSTALVRFIPQTTSPAANGNLVFTENGVTRQLTNAHVDFSSLEVSNRNGHMQSVRIDDRRTWWKFTTITGVYNERRGDGSIITATEKTPRELAVLLLQAMGESVYDVSALPNSTDDRPFVNWDCANPSIELWKLCRDRGCDINLTWGNAVHVVLIGSGSTLPDGNAQTVSFGLDVGEWPQTLRVCGDLLFQAKIKLIPYGSEEDGELRKIEDLSYAPDSMDTWGGWELQDPTDPLYNSSNENLKSIAKQYIWRLYKIDTFADETLDVPGYQAIGDIEQILPIGDKLLQTFENSLDSKVYNLPAYVEGIWAQEVENETDGTSSIVNTAAGTRYPKSFQIYNETGFILFNEPLVKYSDTTGEQEPADLYLVTSFRVRDTSTHNFVKYVRDLTLNGGTGTYPIVREDLRRTIVAQYQDADPTALEAEPDHVVDNLADINTAADAILSNTLPEFQSYPSENRRYAGIQAIDTDGAIRQVTISVDGGGDGRGANTSAARNSEPELGVYRKAEYSRIADAAQDRQQDRLQRSRISEFKQKRIRVD